MVSLACIGVILGSSGILVTFRPLAGFMKIAMHFSERHSK